MTADILVHKELPNFKAFREFCGRHDTCGPNAVVETLASIDPSRWSADCTSMNKLVTKMVANGRLFNGGSTMAGLVDQMRDEGYDVTYDPWMHWHSELNLDQLHQLLKDKSGTDGIVLQVGDAFNLPANEAGVHSHFVAVGGIDSLKGYLIGNGDIPLFRFTGALWCGWGHLISALPTAVCIVRTHIAPPVILTIAEKLTALGYSDTANFNPNIEGVITAKNGTQIVKGFRAALCTGAYIPPPEQAWYGPEMTDGSVSTQVGTVHTLEWSQPTGVTFHPTEPSGRVLAFVQPLLLRDTATDHMKASEKAIAVIKPAAQAMLTAATDIEKAVSLL